MVIDINILKMKKDMNAITAMIRREGFSKEVNVRSTALVDQMTGLMNEIIPEEVEDFIHDNIDFWYGIMEFSATVSNNGDNEAPTF